MVHSHKFHSYSLIKILLVDLFLLVLIRFLFSCRDHMWEMEVLAKQLFLLERGDC